MNILVTGGAGFIGSHLVQYHLAKGDRVKVIDDCSTGTFNNIKKFSTNKNFSFENADILHWTDKDNFIVTADRIYHMAAVLGVYRVLQQPLQVLRTNIMGCEKILHTILERGSKARIIIASSSSVYGNSQKKILNEKDELIISPNTHPLWGYAVSKLSDEAIAKAYYDTYHLPITWVRLFNTIGPRQTGRYGMVVPRFVQQALSGKPLTIFGDGQQTRSFCDVRDAIAAIDKISEMNVSLGEPINVGNDHEIAINELAELVRKLANSSSPITYVSYQDAYGKDFHDITQRRPDLTKLRQLTGFKHAWTVDKTIKDLILNYQHEYSLPVASGF